VGAANTFGTTNRGDDAITSLALASDTQRLVDAMGVKHYDHQIARYRRSRK
jgi:hypothetical protein